MHVSKPFGGHHRFENFPSRIIVISRRRVQFQIIYYYKVRGRRRWEELGKLHLIVWSMRQSTKKAICTRRSGNNGLDIMFVRVLESQNNNCSCSININNKKMLRKVTAKKLFIFIKNKLNLLVYYYNYYFVTTVIVFIFRFYRMHSVLTKGIILEKCFSEVERITRHRKSEIDLNSLCGTLSLKKGKM